MNAAIILGIADRDGTVRRFHAARHAVAFRNGVRRDDQRGVSRRPRFLPDAEQIFEEICHGCAEHGVAV